MNLHFRPSRVPSEGFEFGYAVDEVLGKVFKKCKFKYVSTGKVCTMCVYMRPKKCGKEEADCIGSKTRVASL